MNYQEMRFIKFHQTLKLFFAHRSVTLSNIISSVTKINPKCEPLSTSFLMSCAAFSSKKLKLDFRVVFQFLC